MKREEALKILQKLHDTALFSVRTALETLIPKLAESEDERIRKEIYNFLIDMECKKEWITYLEKQKEQIPYTDFVIKPHKGDDNNPYDMRVSEAQEYAIKRGFGIPFSNGEVYVDDRHLTQTIGNILRWADEHPKEQKSDIWKPSEYQIQLLLSVINDPNNAASASAHLALKSLYNDLKKL